MLFTLPDLERAVVVSRPSKVIKSPYVADVTVGDCLAQCHSPGLGCNGMVSSGSIVHVSRNDGSTKTRYTTHMAEVVDTAGTVYVGIHPMISQKVAGLLLGRLGTAASSWKTEVTCLDSRLDFVGDCPPTGRKIYVEVKNAMICKDISVERGSRRALFPDGFRRPGSETTSPRAVKHAETLTALAKLQDTEAAYLVFIVPRDDCGGGLELNRADPVYCAAVITALRAGVKVVVFALSYKKNSAIEFYKRLPLIIP